MGKLVDMMNEAIDKKHGDLWTCRSCGSPVTIEEVKLSYNALYKITLWNCEPCQTVGVTPESIREPPTRLASKLKPHQTDVQSEIF